MAFAIKTATTIPDSRQLWNAIDCGNVEELENVLASESLINSRDVHGVTPLMRAACHDRVEVVRTLINGGADVNAARSDGFTPLLLAIFYGHAAIVRVLCESGADVNVTTRFGTSAHMWAVARGFYDIADYLEAQPKLTKQPVENNLTVDELKLPVLTVVEVEDARAKRLDDVPTVNVSGSTPIYVAHETEKATEESRTPKEPLVVRKLKEPPEIWELVPPKQSHLGSDSGRKTKTRERKPLLSEQLVVRTLKEPPDIWDLVHENNDSFHVGSAFFARITSIKAKTLLVVSILVGAFGTFVALNWRTLLNRTPPSAVAPSTSSQIFSDAKPQVGNAAKVDVGTNQTASAQQVASDGTSTSTTVGPSNIGEVGGSATDSNVPGSRPGSYRGQRRAKRSLDAIEPPPNTAERSQTKSSETSDAASGNRRTASNAPAAKPPANGGNSQLIERPSGNAPPKPKIIQWP